MATSDLPTKLQISLDKRKDLNKCIICQKVKENKRTTKLTSIEQGRRTILDCSVHLKDNFLESIQESDHGKIQYHVNNCYPRCVRSKERAEKSHHSRTTWAINDINIFQSQKSADSRPTGRKLESTLCTPPAGKPCIVCNHKKSKGDSRRFRICEARRACLFLSASNFNKDAVYTRCVLLESCGNVYAADIMYHKNCLSNYVRKFESDIKEIMNPSLEFPDGMEITK